MAGVIVVLCGLFLNQCKRANVAEKEAINLANALSDTLVGKRLSDSSYKATIRVLQTTSDGAFLDLISSDEEIKKLQALVKEYKGKLKPGGTVNTGNIKTDVTHTGKPTVVSKDTVTKDSLVYIYPQYSDSLVNGWVYVKYRASKDSSKIDVQVENPFDIVVSEKKGELIIDLMTESPYSTVKSLRAYQKKLPKIKRFGIGPNVSYGINPDFKKNIFVGIGLQYNIIRL